jgi:hypothetical protein
VLLGVDVLQPILRNSRRSLLTACRVESVLRGSLITGQGRRIVMGKHGGDEDIQPDDYCQEDSGPDDEGDAL